MNRITRLAFTLLCVTGIGCGSSAPSTAPSANSGQAASAGQSASVGESSVASQKAAASATAATAIGAKCEKRPMKFDPTKIELSGAWLPNDGGIYYIRQLGKTIWWNGMSERDRPAAQLGRDWNNVARGEIKPDLTVQIEWSDVPRGEILGSGTMVWKIADDGTGNVNLVKLSEPTGTGFGGEAFVPCTPG